MAEFKTAPSPIDRCVLGKVREPHVEQNPSVLWGDWPGRFLSPSEPDPMPSTEAVKEVEGVDGRQKHPT